MSSQNAQRRAIAAAFEARFARRTNRLQRDFERQQELRSRLSQGSLTSKSGGLPSSQSAVELLLALYPQVTRMFRAVLDVSWSKVPASSFQLRKAISRACLIASIALFGVASVFFIYWGDYSPEHWKRRIAERSLSGIYDRSGGLVGAMLIPATRKMTVSESYRLGFIPLSPDQQVPPAYRAALLEREDRGLRDNTVFHVCGIDWLKLPFAWVRGRGGSTLVMQIVKNLEGWGEEKSFLQKVGRKLKELPAACQLHRYLVSGDGDAVENVVRLYASMHTIWTPGTGIRGIEAGAKVTFAQNITDLSQAEQLILSAVTAGPLAPLEEADEARPQCSRIWPLKNNIDFDAEIERLVRATADNSARRRFYAWKNQCKALWRAKLSADLLRKRGEIFVNDQDYDKAVESIDRLTAEGIRPSSEFSSISDEESVNLAQRTKTLLGANLLNVLAIEARQTAGTNPGTPLILTIDAEAQKETAQRLTSAVKQVQKRFSGDLCSPIAENVIDAVDARSWRRRCNQRGSSEAALAVLVNISLGTGQVLFNYSSYPYAFESRLPLGSIAKWPIALAAVRAGFSAETLLCPKASTRDGRPLRRFSKVASEGYLDCRNGRGELNLAEAIAHSDNLAIFELANRIGVQELNSALQELGLLPHADPAYMLSFGNYTATLFEVIGMSHRMVAAAYPSIRVQAIGPSLLARTGASSKADYPQLSKMQTQVLQILMEAPISIAGGTLTGGRLENRGIRGGKSGTTNSSVRSSNNDAYVANKWSVFYDDDLRSLTVAVVSSSSLNIPLAKPGKSGFFLDFEQLGLNPTIVAKRN